MKNYIKDDISTRDQGIQLAFECLQEFRGYTLTKVPGKQKKSPRIMTKNGQDPFLAWFSSGTNDTGNFAIEVFKNYPTEDGWYPELTKNNVSLMVKILNTPTKQHVYCLSVARLNKFIENNKKRYNISTLRPVAKFKSGQQPNDTRNWLIQIRELVEQNVVVAKFAKVDDKWYHLDSNLKPMGYTPPASGNTLIGFEA